MAEPGTSYIDLRSCEMLKKNEMYSRKMQFYTGLIDWSLLVEKAAKAVPDPACK